MEIEIDNKKRKKPRVQPSYPIDQKIPKYSNFIGFLEKAIETLIDGQRGSGTLWRDEDFEVYIGLTGQDKVRVSCKKIKDLTVYVNLHQIFSAYENQHYEETKTTLRKEEEERVKTEIDKLNQKAVELTTHIKDNKNYVEYGQVLVHHVFESKDKKKRRKALIEMQHHFREGGGTSFLIDEIKEEEMEDRREELKNAKLLWFGIGMLFTLLIYLIIKWRTEIFKFPSFFQL